MKRSKKIIVICTTALLGFTLLFINCLWVTSFETAQTAPPGQIQFGGSVSPFMTFTADGESETAILPFPMTSIKLGVAERFDMGLKWGFGPGLGLNAKYQFLKNNLDGAFYFETLYYGLGTVGGDNVFSVYNIRPAIIISNEKPGTFPFSAALGLHYWNTGVLGSRVGITSLVGNIGLPFRTGSRHAIRVMPEIGILLPITGKVSGDDDDQFEFTGQTIMQFGIGISGANPIDF